jgi:purine-binding chemotaxis protein CheW
MENLRAMKPIKISRATEDPLEGPRREIGHGQLQGAFSAQRYSTHEGPVPPDADSIDRVEDYAEEKKEKTMSVETITETRQYLSFKLDEEEFALDISKVREVLDFTKITKVPQTPDFMKGVINLRGSVVPVVDLNRKFGIKDTEKTVNTRIIIGEISIEGDETVLGVLADSVHEVMDIEPENIEPAPRIGTRLNTDFIKGMGRRDEEFVMILDIDKVFSSDDLSMVNLAGQTHVNAEAIESAL